MNEVFVTNFELIYNFQQQQRASSVMQAAPGSLEEKLAALEKQKDYQSGFNNLTADNVDLPNKSAITVG